MQRNNMKKLLAIFVVFFGINFNIPTPVSASVGGESIKPTDYIKIIEDLDERSYMISNNCKMKRYLSGKRSYDKLLGAGNDKYSYDINNNSERNCQAGIQIYMLTKSSAANLVKNKPTCWIGNDKGENSWCAGSQNADGKNRQCKGTCDVPECSGGKWTPNTMGTKKAVFVNENDKIIWGKNGKKPLSLVSFNVQGDFDLKCIGYICEEGETRTYGCPDGSCTDPCPDNITVDPDNTPDNDDDNNGGDDNGADNSSSADTPKLNPPHSAKPYMNKLKTKYKISTNQ